MEYVDEEHKEQIATVQTQSWVAVLRTGIACFFLLLQLTRDLLRKIHNRHHYIPYIFTQSFFPKKIFELTHFS